jgi:toxin-antitoxin system PIN domain toxin
MKLVDANLLIYAVNSDLAHHPKARHWLEGQLSDGASVGLPWVVVLAFLRICTSARVFERPLTGAEAMAIMDDWLSRPGVRTIAPGPHHWPVLRELIAASGTAGNLITDAHIAALAIEHGAVVYSADNDFKRFAGVRHVNPLLDRVR